MACFCYLQNNECILAFNMTLLLRQLFHELRSTIRPSSWSIRGNIPQNHHTLGNIGPGRKIPKFNASRGESPLPRFLDRWCAWLGGYSRLAEFFRCKVLYCTLYIIGNPFAELRPFWTRSRTFSPFILLLRSPAPLFTRVFVNPKFPCTLEQGK